MRVKVLANGAWIACVAVGLAVVGCGSSSSDISCGAGTKQSGSKCIAAAGGAAGAAGAGGTAGTSGTGGSSGSAGTGGAAGDDGGVVNPGPTFAGVVAVAPVSDVSLQVSWADASDAKTATEDIVYKVYVATAAGQQNFGAAQVTTPPGAQSAIVSGLQPDTDYYIVVRAMNAAGIEDSNTVEKTAKPVVDTAAPTFAGAKSAKTVGDTSIEVDWDPATDDHSPAEAITYVVTWATSDAGAPTGKIGKVTVPGATSAIVDTLPDPETTYYFTVRAQDAAGNGEENVATVSADTGKDLTPPVFGGCVAAVQPGATNMVVSWDAARDDTTSADKMKYNVYAFTSPVDDSTPFGVPQTTFTGGTSGVVTGLKADTTYYFVCRAQDASGNEDENIAFRTATTLTDGTPPTFNGVTTSDIDSTSITLHWDAATDDKTAQPDIVYNIYQSTTAGDALNQPSVAQSNPGDTAFKVTGLTSNTQYYFVVTAVDKAGNESTNATESSSTTYVSFEIDVQQGILSVYCAKSGCHNADNPPQGLNMSDGFAYYNLVDVSAVEYPALKRINSDGVPDDCYLYRKITGHGNDDFACHTAGSGGTDVCGTSPVMPPSGNTPPTAADIDTIKQWISQGALNN